MELDNDKLSIRIMIAERSYPMTILRDDEEKIRRAAKLINEKIILYKQRYTNKDTQDVLAMTTIQFATGLLEMESKQDFLPVVEALQSLNNELDIYIESNRKDVL